MNAVVAGGRTLLHNVAGSRQVRALVAEEGVDESQPGPAPNRERGIEWGKPARQPVRASSRFSASLAADVASTYLPMDRSAAGALAVGLYPKRIS